MPDIENRIVTLWDLQHYEVQRSVMTILVQQMCKPSGLLTEMRDPFMNHDLTLMEVVVHIQYNIQ